MNQINLETACAKVYGITVQRYGQLAKDGIVPRSVKGQIDFIVSTKAIVDYYRKRAEGSGSATLTDERTRLTRLDANLREIELAEKNQEVLPYDEVKADWIKVLGIMKARLLNIPSKYAPVCFGKTIPEIKEIVEGGIYQVLDELSQLEYEDRKITERGVKHPKAAAEDDGKRVGRRRKGIKSRGKRRAR